MQVQVGQYIADLLYDHEEVVIPGLGTFQLTPRSAEVDPAQGTLQPPSKSIAFDASLAIDDGKLIEHISEQTGRTVNEARLAVQEYVKEQKQKLQQKEIVIIDQVGRLYIDFENKLQFLPDTTNFETDSFGLPFVDADPVPEAKPANDPQQPAVAQPGEVVAAAQTKNARKSLQGVLIGFAILAVAAVIVYLSYDRFFGPDPADPTSEIPATRHNVPPPPVDSGALEEPLDFPSQMEESAEEESDESGYEDSDTEASTPAPDQKSAVIAIGVFRNQENVNKLVEQIYQAGYEPYLQESNGRTRVGLQLSYQEMQEVQAALDLAREKFAPDAFIMKK